MCSRIINYKIVENNSKRIIDKMVNNRSSYKIYRKIITITIIKFIISDKMNKSPSLLTINSIPIYPTTITISIYPITITINPITIITHIYRDNNYHLNHPTVRYNIQNQCRTQQQTSTLTIM